MLENAFSQARDNVQKLLGQAGNAIGNVVNAFQQPVPQQTIGPQPLPMSIRASGPDPVSSFMQQAQGIMGSFGNAIQGYQQQFQQPVQLQTSFPMSKLKAKNLGDIGMAIGGLRTGINQTLGMNPDTSGEPINNPNYQLGQKIGNIGGMAFPIPGMNVHVPPEALAALPLLAGKIKLIKPLEEAMSKAEQGVGGEGNPGEIQKVAGNLIKNNPGLPQKEAEAMAKDVISNRSPNVVNQTINDTGKLPPPIFNNLDKGDLATYGKDVAGIGGSQNPITDRLGVLGQAHKSQTVRAVSRWIMGAEKGNGPYSLEQVKGFLDNPETLPINGGARELSKYPAETNVLKETINNLTPTQTINDVGAAGKPNEVPPVKSPQPLAAEKVTNSKLPLALPESIPQGNPEPLPFETPEYLKANPKAQEALPNTNINTLEKQGFSQPPQKPPPVTGANPVQDVNAIGEQVRLAHSGAENQMKVRGNTLASQAEIALKTPEDQNLFRTAMQHPDQIEELSQKSSNPQLFTHLNQMVSSAFDQVANFAKEKKLDMNFVQDYYPQIWDLSTPQAREIYDNLARTSNFRSGFTKERIFQNIEEGQAAGLQLKNPNVSQDIVQYFNSMGRQIANSAMTEKANELMPNSMVPLGKGGVPRDYNNRPYLQSPVPGQQGTFVAPELHQQLTTYQRSALADNPLLAGKDIKVGDSTLHIPGIDQLNQLDKQAKLALGGFHPLNTTMRQLANDPTAIPSAVRSMFDSNYRTRVMQKAIDDGVVDFASKHGMTFSQSGDVGKMGESVVGTLRGLNPIQKFNNSVFGGMINTYKLNLARSMMEKFPDTAINPLMERQAQLYAKQVNNLMGGLNYEAMGRNRTVQQVLRLVGLAPDFSEGTINQVLTAVNPAKYANAESRPAALFALKNVVGQVVIYAGLAELGRRLVTGAFSPDFKSFVANSIVKPNIPLPNNPTFNNPRTGKTQTASLPSSEFSTMLGAVTNPGHFLQARGSGAVAIGTALQTGKNYYGGPLVDPFSGQQDNLANRAKAILPEQAPIPVQQIQKMQAGKQTPAVTALNIAGVRVGNNPNDPTVVAQKTYFDALKQTTNSLNPNQQALWSSLHPTKKDADGNIVFTPGNISTDQKATIYLNNPDIENAEIRLAQQLKAKGQPTDPLWDLPWQQRALVWASQAHLPGQTTALTKEVYNQSWYPAFQQAQQQFYDQIAKQNPAQPPPTSNGQPKPVAPQPSAYVSQQMNAKNWNDPQVQAYLNANTNYNNQRLISMGLPPMTGSGSSSGSGFSFQRRMIRQKVKQITRRGSPKSAAHGNIGVKSNTRIALKVPKFKAVKKLTAMKTSGIKVASKV